MDLGPGEVSPCRAMCLMASCWHEVRTWLVTNQSFSRMCQCVCMPSTSVGWGMHTQWLYRTGATLRCFITYPLNVPQACAGLIETCLKCQVTHISLLPASLTYFGKCGWFISSLSRRGSNHWSNLSTSELFPKGSLWECAWKKKLYQYYGPRSSRVKSDSSGQEKGHGSSCRRDTDVSACEKPDTSL